MKKKRYISLNIKVFVLALILMIIPSLIIGTLMFEKSIDVIQQKQKIQVEIALKNISDSAEMDMKNARDLSLFIISDSNVRKALKAKDIKQGDKIEYQNRIMSNLSFFVGNNSYINGLKIQGYNGMEVSIGSNNLELTEGDITRARQLKGGYTWKWKKNNNKTALCLIRQINDIEHTNIELGIMQIELADNMIKSQFHEFLEVYPGYVALYHQNGKCITEYGKNVFDKNRIKHLVENKESKDFVEYLNKNQDLTYLYKIPNSDFVLVSCMQFKMLYAENDSIKMLLAGGVLCSFFLCLLVEYLFSKRIIKPLKQLTKKIQEIANENYKIQLNFSSNDEIGILAVNFNNMAKRLDELVNEVIKEKILQKEAQLKALQAQINPHFLYNNLDTAYWMSRLEKAEKTGKILLALSALYRSAVNTEGKLISVEMEKNYLEEYILIQKLRLDKMVEFHLDISQEALKYTTLRFILQPLVENSIEHGILPGGEQGCIYVKLYIKDEILLFEIEDSGKGESVDTLEKIVMKTDSEEKKGMALRNIHERIKLQYGEQYGLFFERSKLGGIRVIVKQPLILYKKESPDFSEKSV